MHLKTLKKEVFASNTTTIVLCYNKCHVLVIEYYTFAYENITRRIILHTHTVVNTTGREVFKNKKVCRRVVTYA